MGRRRKRRSRGGVSRRRFLAGSLLALGGASILGGTQAFSQTEAVREASVQSTTDESGLLGIEIPEIVPVGVGDTDLVQVTNNTSSELTASINVPDLRADESYGPSQHVLAQGQSGQSTASLGVDRAIDEDDVDIDITGSSDDITIQLSRTAPVPGFAYQIIDNTKDGNAQFGIQYDVSNVPSFDSITIRVEDVSEDWGPTERFTPETSSGVVSFPDETDATGTGGHDYAISFQADDLNAGTVLDETVTVTADGSDQGEGDLGDENDPVLDWMFVDDLSEESTNSVEYTVYYQVSNLDNFGNVEVTFDHDDGWASNTVTTNQNPVGKVKHTEGETSDGFDITTKVQNQSGITVDSAPQSDSANGDNPSNPDTAEADSPTFDTLTVADESSNGGAEYTVTYSIANDTRFGQVRAYFENQGGNPETNERIRDDTGQLTYSTGYTGGDPYHITIRIFEERDGVFIPVEREVYEDDAAGGTDPSRST